MPRSVRSRARARGGNLLARPVDLVYDALLQNPHLKLGIIHISTMQTPAPNPTNRKDIPSTRHILSSIHSVLSVQVQTQEQEDQLRGSCVPTRQLDIMTIRERLTCRSRMTAGSRGKTDFLLM
jgi:hypothetical protein